MSLLPIHRTDLLKYIGVAKTILDVGCGDRPLPIATCIADKLPETVRRNGRRFPENPSGKVKNQFGIPFVEATLPDLPFEDGAFDFVFCSHVIEHVDDIEAAIKTLSRVAPRGYLECPRGWFEYIDGSPFHKWHIDFDGDALLLKRKTKEEEAFCLERRLFDRDRSLFSRLYGAREASYIQGIEDTSRRQLRYRLKLLLKPRSYPPLSVQKTNKAFTNLSLYWEKEIPYRILAPSVYPKGTAFLPGHPA